MLMALQVMLLSCSKKEKQNATPATNDFPQMSVVTLESEQVNMKALTGKTVIILFFPDCDHCQREATAIQEHLSAFNGYELYFLSTAAKAEIEKFSADYKLNGNDNIHFAVTTVQDVLNNFGAVEAPSIYLYSEEGKRTKYFNGETPIEEILKSL